MNLQVSSVSKREQKLSEVAAALFVITQDDIRHSGALNVPDLLRMVPGLDVAQINANTWAISSRGFNSEFAGKLLVLVDGRAVYTPLFGGVNWDTLDLPLEDIERIEVIRGPGGAIWGANAVNGVINIITRKAADTQGGLVVGGGGTTAQGFGTVQYGGKLGQATSYRFFTKYLNDDHFVDFVGASGDDGWHLLHSGFRVDSTLSGKDKLTTEGDLYAGGEGSTIIHSILNPPQNVSLDKVTPLSGGNLSGKWDHVFSDRADFTVQAYFDRYARSGPESRETRDTFDIEFQNHFRWGARQDFIWGAGYRYSQDADLGTIDQAFIPANWSGNLFTTFVQDQIALKPDRVLLYVGTKLENSYFTGFDLEPSIRVAWTPEKKQTVWAAVSRATRTPTRRDEGLQAALAALPGPTEVLIEGSPNFKSEHEISYEVGYRAQPAKRISLGIETFISSYTGLESIEPQPSFVDSTFTPPITVNPLQLANLMRGSTYGVETWVEWKITDRWKLAPAYTFLHMDLLLAPTSQDAVSVTDGEGSSPHQQANLRSHFEATHSFSWDANVYFVDRLLAQGVPAYTRLDSQLSWKLSERLTFSAVGQNLLRDRHLEFDDFLQAVNTSQIKRSAYGKLTWQF